MNDLGVTVEQRTNAFFVIFAKTADMIDERLVGVAGGSGAENEPAARAYALKLARLAGQIYGLHRLSWRVPTEP